jgi:hypothetical protein
MVHGKRNRKLVSNLLINFKDGEQKRGELVACAEVLKFKLIYEGRIIEKHTELPHLKEK